MYRSSDTGGDKKDLLSQSRRLHVEAGVLRSRAAEAVGQTQRIRVQARVVRTRTSRVKQEVKRKHALPAQPRLSRREAEVLALLTHGLTTKALAIQLGISLNTANYHLSNLYRKLGTHNRVEATNAYHGRRSRS